MVELIERIIHDHLMVSSNRSDGASGSYAAELAYLREFFSVRQQFENAFAHLGVVFLCESSVTARVNVGKSQASKWGGEDSPDSRFLCNDHFQGASSQIKEETGWNIGRGVRAGERIEGLLSV